jgi:hypothetical protein
MRAARRTEEPQNSTRAAGLRSVGALGPRVPGTGIVPSMIPVRAVVKGHPMIFQGVAGGKASSVRRTFYP